MLYFSMLLGRVRATGRCEQIAFHAAGRAGQTAPTVFPEYQKFLANTREGADLRTKYSDIVLYVDGHMRHHHGYPDPAVAEAERLKREIHYAKVARDEAARAETTAQATAAAAKSAKAERAAADAKVAELEKKLASVQPLPAAPATPPPAAPPAPPAEPPPKAPTGVAADLAKLDDKTLREVVAPEYKLDPAAFKSREELIAAILAAAGYKK